MTSLFRQTGEIWRQPNRVAQRLHAAFPIFLKTNGKMAKTQVTKEPFRESEKVTRGWKDAV
jgi:hypothetical protein